MMYDPVNNFSVMSGRFPVFLGGTSTKQQIKCLAPGYNIVTPPVVSLELATLRSPIYTLPTEPLRSTQVGKEIINQNIC